MNILLQRVGLPVDYAPKAAQMRIIRGELKSPLRKRWPIRVLQEDGTEIKTARVCRAGSGWVITEDASYIVCFHSIRPPSPLFFHDIMENYFSNENEIFSRVNDLILSANEVHDYPIFRDHGYPEFVSKALDLELLKQADIASEGDCPIEDAHRVLVATISSKASEIFKKMHQVDYRQRIVLVGTRHRVRGEDAPERVLFAFAVYADGRVLHCLSRELPLNMKDLAGHLKRLHELMQCVARRERTERQERTLLSSESVHCPSVEGVLWPKEVRDE